MSDYNKRSFHSIAIFMLLAVISLNSSCISVKKYNYFKDLPDTSSKIVTIDQVTPYVDLKIEPSDILSIVAQPMLLPIVTSSGNGINTGYNNTSTTQNQINLFPVDKNGFIEYSLLGLVKVAGLTTGEARDEIRKRLKQYYQDPVVNVRIDNFQISILGDVNRVGKFTSPNEKLSIIDAITNAGDLQTSGKRDNILLIRSAGDQKICARYDITNSSIFRNPYFYLKQNDIIYVEPNKYKVQSSDQTFIRNLGILSSIISIASLVLVYRSLK